MNQAWYGLQRWRNRARQQLRAYPLCTLCMQKGLVVAASVADHIEPHKGNFEAFWHGELQSLCASCHNSVKQSREKLGYDKEIGQDGWPIDSHHPANGHRF